MPVHPQGGFTWRSGRPPLPYWQASHSPPFDGCAVVEVQRIKWKARSGHEKAAGLAAA